MYLKISLRELTQSRNETVANQTEPSQARGQYRNCSLHHWSVLNQRHVQLRTRVFRWQRWSNALFFTHHTGPTTRFPFLPTTTTKYIREETRATTTEIFKRKLSIYWRQITGLDQTLKKFKTLLERIENYVYCLIHCFKYKQKS